MHELVRRSFFVYNGPVKKRKPKVSLSAKRVVILTAVIFLLCFLLVLMNILFKPDSSSPASSKGTGSKPAVEKTEGRSSGRKTEAGTEGSKKAPEKDTGKEDAGKPAKAPSHEDKANASPSQEKSREKIQDKPAAAVKPAVSVPAPEPVPEKPKFDIPKAAEKAVLVFVIDDAGLNVEYTKRYATLPFPITIAVLPKLPHTKDCAYVVRSNGKELILHQPMQSMNLKLDPGPGKITADMKGLEILRTVQENLAELGPGVKGINNHEGSLITSDPIKIGYVMDVCDKEGIYFLDSRTTKDTQAPQAALERGTDFYEKNAPYIDNVLTREAMLSEIYKCLDVANKKGIAIMIGHVDKSADILPALLNEMYPYLVEKGYRFATPSTCGY